MSMENDAIKREVDFPNGEVARQRLFEDSQSNIPAVSIERQSDENQMGMLPQLEITQSADSYAADKTNVQLENRNQKPANPIGRPGSDPAQDWIEQEWEMNHPELSHVRPSRPEDLHGDRRPGSDPAQEWIVLRHYSW